MNLPSTAVNPASAIEPIQPGTVSGDLAEYVAAFSLDEIPERTRERAKYLMLDAIGIALASTRYDFSHRILSGMSALAGGGDCSVIGMAARLPLRDAVLTNGMLVHGLDYDDTHLDGAVHPTASALPCALGLAEHIGGSGRDLLAAYVLGVEIAARIGMAGSFGFHHVGFHPTGIIGHFSCALQAGWLLRLNARQLTMAQGIVGSTAAASQEFLADGAWNKRMHPGWAGVGGITAAYLARSGFKGALRTYEGRFGLFKSHLHENEGKVDYSKITAGLGEVWEVFNTAVKPYPVCHFIHACADAALALKREHGLKPDGIERIRVLLPREGLPIVAEPEQRKRRPVNSYEAQFSVQFVVAACLLRDRFGLAELEDDVLADPRILALAEKVECAADPDTAFPKYYSGGVVISTTDGREFRRHEMVNRGAGDRALDGAEIEAKFIGNAQLSTSPGRARELQDLILDLESHTARDIAAALSA